MRLNSRRALTVAVWTVEFECLAACLPVLGRAEQLAESRLVQIAERERGVTQVHASVCPYPEHLVGVARYRHVGPFQRPIRNRSDRRRRLGKQIAVFVPQSKELSCEAHQGFAVKMSELQHLVRAFGEVGQRVVNEIDLKRESIPSSEGPGAAQQCD